MPLLRISCLLQPRPSGGSSRPHSPSSGTSWQACSTRSALSALCVFLCSTYCPAAAPVPVCWRL